MARFTQKFSTLILEATIRVAAIALFLVGFGTSTSFAQTTAYVTNRFDNTVSVIDTATNTVVATLPVGGTPAAVDVTPDGAFAYIANANDGTVSVINTATNTVVASSLNKSTASVEPCHDLLIFRIVTKRIKCFISCNHCSIGEAFFNRCV